MSWWNDSVGYEIYLRSFADGNGDGIGDFSGLTSRLEYLADLGVDVVWVTPFYPSPQADFGYDVADYYDVDPMYGTLADFDRFVERAGGLGIRVVTDIVPNHSSSQHRWFREAVENGPDSPYWNYYVWRDPGPDGGHPNNWQSMFGGPAWTYVERWDKYYMHLFLPEQPDLNWTEPAVAEEFKEILEFWIDRGVSGFRIDVAHTLLEHASFADNPPRPDLGAGASPQVFADYEHRFDIDQPETPAIYREWKRVVGSDILLLGEVYLERPHLVRKYVGGGALDQSFFFGLNHLAWDPAEFTARIREAVEVIPEGWSWVQGSHDEHRSVTRFGGGQEGRERSLALWVAMMGLPGMPFIYQGDELALENGVVALENVVDPVGKHTPEAGRDPARTPMPWTIGHLNGFTEGERAWLIAEERRAEDTVEHQKAVEDSPLNRMQRLIEVRRDTAALRTTFSWLDSPVGTLVFTRGGVIHAVNLNDDAVAVEVGSGWSLRHATSAATKLDESRLQMPPRSGTVLVSA